jgi:hypothetical protein
MAVLDYKTHWLLGAGAVDGTEALAKARFAARSTHDPLSQPHILVLWIEAAAVQAGDRVQFSLHGPDGQQIVRQSTRQKKNQATAFHYVGMPRPAKGWPVGEYRAAVEWFDSKNHRMLRYAWNVVINQ